jgi:hypothetical protein
MRIRRCPLSLVLVCSFVLVVIPLAVSSEGLAAEGSVAPQHVLSTNPILVMFTWYNLEYEQAFTETTSGGITASYVKFGDEDDFDEETYTSVSAVCRYYPQGSVLHGFFFGGRLGYYSVTAQEDITGDEESGKFFGFGIDIGYNWLLGVEEKFAVSLGIGAVRLFGGDLEDVDVSLTLPTVRLINVGIAF